MVRLLVVADDFTGALDTGVQFKAKNSLVLIYKKDTENLRTVMKKDIQVLIIDAETRHMRCREAFQTIFDIVSMAVESGIPYIYKKTDSGMRGNIGSELSSFLRASGGKQIHYIPAFPQMGRTTVNGIHYIDGVPVSESVFGADPFEPVLESSVKDIIARQSDVPVHQMGKSAVDGGEEGILVYDSSTEEEMRVLAAELKQNDQLHLLAGCAGFAAILFGMLGLETDERILPDFSKSLLTLCGSINSVTVGQLDYASARGMYRIALSPEQKLEKGWLRSSDGERCIAAWGEASNTYGDVIIECGVHDMEATSSYMKGAGIELAEGRKRIACVMGGVLERLLDWGLESTLLVTGGDTLLAFMQHIGQNTLVPVCELIPGVVLSGFMYRGKGYDLLSKSGGFGQEDLLLTLADIIRQRKK